LQRSDAILAHLSFDTIGSLPGLTEIDFCVRGIQLKRVFAGDRLFQEKRRL